MSLNLFDDVMGTGDDQLDGWLSDLNKKRKELSRKVRKAVKKVVPKPVAKLMDKVEAEGRRMDESGLTKKLAIVAAGVGLAMVGGPMVAAAFKGAAGAGATAAAGAASTAVATTTATAATTAAATTATTSVGLLAKGAALVKAGVGAAAKVAASGALATGAKVYADYQGAKKEAKVIEAQLAAETEAEAQATGQIAQVIGSNPQFKEVVDRLRAEGYSEQAILQHWVESKNYYQAATTQMMQATYPQLYTYATNQGLPPEYAEDYALMESSAIADQAVQQIRSEFAAGDLVKLALPLAALFLMSK